MDSGWVYNTILPSLYYYDIRHPLMSVFTFPIYAVSNLVFSSTFIAVFVQFINIQLLIITAFELKLLTKNKYVFWLYIVSFPSIIYLVFFEKYIFVVFLLVTYLYNTFYKKKEFDITVILAASIMPTSLFIGISEFFKDMKIKKIIINIFKLAIAALIIVICTGRVHCLKYGYSNLTSTYTTYTKKTYTLVNKINSTSHMITGAIISLPSGNTSNRYLWTNILDNISYIGVAITLVIIIGLFRMLKERDKVYLSMMLWYLYSFVIFIMLKWSIHESPLFSVYFSWAIIPLLVYGMDTIFDYFQLEKAKQYFWILMIAITFIINMRTIIDIYHFL